MPYPKISDWAFMMLSALFFTLAGNIAFWKNALTLLPFSTLSHVIFIFSLFVFIFCFINILLSCLLWSCIQKPLLILLLFASAAVNYFSVSYGVYIDKSMIQNMMGTDYGEAKSLLTPQIFIWLTLLGLIPAWVFAHITIRPQPLLKKAGIRGVNMMISAVVLLLVSLPLYKDYASFFRNNKEIVKLITPTNYLAASYAYMMQKIEGNKPLQAIGLDARRMKKSPNEKPKLVIFVLGETARAHNFSLMGYERKTNPMLEQEENLLAFQNTSSCGTATAISVPCMFSNMIRKNYSGSQASHQENVLDILARTGINVFWRENNTGCQGVCTRITSDVIHFYQTQTDCPNDFCFDEYLLDGLDAYIAQNAQKDNFIVLHMIGSHGPTYYQRYPKESAAFMPTCDTNQIQNCTQEELINTYDNGIVYTDQVLSKTISILKQHTNDFETAMLYVSDHGESLGENGIYLHATPYAIAPKMQTHVPMIFWASEEFYKANQMDYACLKNSAQKDDYSQDYIFSTILGLMRVETAEYDPSLDLFSRCKTPSFSGSD